MDKKSKKSIVISLSLITLLVTGRVTVDKLTSNLNTKIISYSKSQEEDINFVAHRGYSNTYPDNTYEGIVACNELECINGIEVDVRLTKDNKLILMHNGYVGLKHVYEYTFEELCNMNLLSSLFSRPILFKGYNFREQSILAKRYEEGIANSYNLCTLEDVLKTRDKSKILFIDIKFSNYNDDLLMRKIGELVKGEENIIIQSFDENRLRQMRELYPSYKYQLLIDSRQGLSSIDYIYDAYGINYNVAAEDVVKDIIEHDKQVSLWTIDSYRDFILLQDEYSEYNEDIYYITDNPDILGYQYSLRKSKRVD